ncbi:MULTISPECIES: homoserine dehydrogenase [unclassified Neisseria]|uniref:homoserine dehydrogenase n=1 Tax=unclassified Neisseria TaxID=2623750 RepID=UPI0026664664|nr:MULTISPECIES: homoserine dehydrogenase [unclassified Neisseria]MDO1509187.1 homoserine dehydrogenase [Neisseria sp. MVDL19-042950]MDO1515534.1 homoserine dehydrogenase [Neisseria sp. MVDL18-041461]MDO1562893.1 homoserine dehydrogenase [Neisseria sp. MVDL20-010259]
MKPVNIGILGLGTVGSGAVGVLRKNAVEISRRLGRDVNVFIVSTRDAEKARAVCDTHTLVTNDPFSVVKHPEVDIVVELFGGTEIARELVLEAINNGKHIVTANKKLLAEYGNEIFSLAEQKNVMVQFEAAVAGGIPIIKALREGLTANNIKSIAGIINGTSNFILTEMREKGSAFADVLKQAQELGYAEADPTFDIEGHDAGHKITIMSALAFGTPVNFKACYLEGISKLDSRDIKYAEELGYRVKLLGITRKTDKGIELRVHPTLIPECRLLANVNGVMNAVRVDADMVGETLYYGAGAGALPTASAVVADIVDISRLITADTGNRVPHLAFQPSQVKAQNMLSMDEITSSYYLRVQAKDEPGVLGQIANLLAKENVSIEALIQKGVIKQTIAEIVILTHSTVEKNIKKAIVAIEALDCVYEPIVMIRMESLHASNG